MTHNREGLQYNECPRSVSQTFIKTLTSLGDLHPSHHLHLQLYTSNQSRIISGAASKSNLSCISSTPVLSHYFSPSLLCLAAPITPFNCKFVFYDQIGAAWTSIINYDDTPRSLTIGRVIILIINLSNFWAFLSPVTVEKGEYL